MNGKWSARNVYKEIHQNRRDVVLEAQRKENIEDATETASDSELHIFHENNDQEGSSQNEVVWIHFRLFYPIICGNKFVKQNTFFLRQKSGAILYHSEINDMLLFLTNFSSLLTCRVATHLNMHVNTTVMIDYNLLE